MKVNIEQLSNFQLFRDLTNSQISILAEKMTLRNYKNDEVIIKEGECGDELFVLLDGEISISKRLTQHCDDIDDPKDKSFAKLNADQHIFFGEMGLVGLDNRTATVIALTDVKLGMLTSEQITLICKENPQIGYQLFFNISKKLALDLSRTNKDVLKLTTALCLALEGSG